MKPEIRSWYEDQHEEPRYTSPMGGGVDHGSTGRIIAEVRRGNAMHRRLIWFRGYKTASCGVRGFGHVYMQASLRVTDRIGMNVRTIVEGGRLSQTLLDANAGAIGTLLETDVAGMLRLDRTLIIVKD